MRLPNGDHAVVERAKFTGYCLNRDHPRGRHKARVFESALGLTERDVDILRDTLCSLLDRRMFSQRCWTSTVNATC
jgi:hypothetical protein